MAYETRLTALDGGVARITLNRPEVRNALSRTMVQELETALAAAEALDMGLVITLVGFSDDAKEGIAAFVDKREPEWKGR